MYPVHPDAALPASFTAVTRAGDFVSLDEEKVSGRLQDWLRDWEAVMR
jgi:ABC-type thiamine transport system substrate-binding protein